MPATKKFTHVKERVLKKDLINFFHTNLHFSKADSEDIINALFSTDGYLAEQILLGKTISLSGFGTFTPRIVWDGKSKCYKVNLKFKLSRSVSIPLAGMWYDIVNQRIKNE